jgi:hypothetical protein
MEFRVIKDRGHTCKLYLNLFFFFAKSLNMAMVQNFEVMLQKMLNHSVYKPVVLYKVISLQSM